MKTFLIGYDLNKAGQDYTSLTTAIKNLTDSWWHCLDSTWIIKSNSTAVELRDFLVQYIDENDEIVVLLLGNDAAWQLREECGNWLNDNL